MKTSLSSPSGQPPSAKPASAMARLVARVAPRRRAAASGAAAKPDATLAPAVPPAVRPLLANCHTAAVAVPLVRRGSVHSVPHPNNCIGEWRYIASPTEFYARLHDTMPGAPWQANMNRALVSMENDYEREVGSWGVRGGSYGAMVGLVLAGITSIACLALPLVNISIPLLGVIISMTSLGLGFAIGFAIQAALRKHWQLTNPDTVLLFRQGIANLKEAIAIKAANDETYDPAFDLRELAAFTSKFEGGFFSTLCQALAAMTPVPIKLILSLRHQRRAMAKARANSSAAAAAPAAAGAHAQGVAK